MQSMNLCVIFRRGKCPIYQIGLSKHSTHHSTILFERGSDLSSKRVQHSLSHPKKMVNNGYASSLAMPWLWYLKYI